MCDRVLTVASASTSASSAAATHSHKVSARRAAVFNGRSSSQLAPARLSRTLRSHAGRGRPHGQAQATSPSSTGTVTVSEAASSSDGTAVRQPPRARGVAVRQRTPTTTPPEESTSGPAAPVISATSDGAEGSSTSAPSAPPGGGAAPAPKTLRRRVQAAKKNAWTIDAPAMPAATVTISAAAKDEEAPADKVHASLSHWASCKFVRFLR